MTLSISSGVRVVEALGRIYSAYQQLEPANKVAVEASLRAIQADEALADADWDAIKPDIELIINTFKGSSST